MVKPSCTCTKLLLVLYLNVDVRLLTRRLIQLNKKLDSIQYQALKIHGAVHGTALSSLQIECGEPSLQLRRNFNNNTYGTKIELHKSHPNNNFKQDNWQKQYFAKKWQETSHHTPFETRYQKN